MSRLVIAVDVDDVLAKHVEGFVAYCNERWNSNLTAQDYIDDWPLLWGLEIEQAKLRAKEIFTPEVMGSYDYIHSARAVLEKLAQEHRLIVITARKVETRELTEQWIDMYFPDIFEHIHMAGFWDVAANAQAVTLTKADICESLGVDVLIDDQLKHCNGVAERGIASIVYGDYHWNRSETLPEGVTRCHSWGEIEEYFDEAAENVVNHTQTVSSHA